MDRESENCRLLLVEDDPAQRAALTATMRRLGFLVEAVEDAESGRRSLRENPPDVVLCDYEIPGGGLSVLDLAREVRSKLPFVLMTARPDPHVRTEALRRGASGFLRKPLTITQVDEAIRSALNGSVEAP